MARNGGWKRWADNAQNISKNRKAENAIRVQKAAQKRKKKIKDGPRRMLNPAGIRDEGTFDPNRQPWSDVLDKDMREIFSSLGAPCCPKGCVGRVQHISAVLEIRNLDSNPQDPQRISVYFNPEHTYSLDETENLITQPSLPVINPMFLCCICHEVWDIDYDRTKIYWMR